VLMQVATVATPLLGGLAAAFLARKMLRHGD
jgi:hypothetical protein